MRRKRAAWLQVQIGCHTDNLTGVSPWKRWPCVTKRVALTGATTTISCPFGGLIFFLARAAAARDLDVVLDNVVPAPHCGYDTASSGDGVVAVDGPAPWGEITGRLVSFCVPRATVARASAAVLEFWDAVLASHHRLSRPPYGGRVERLVVDVQLSLGYMHSGYPVMAHLDLADHVCDVDFLRTGPDIAWGVFHEFGHNMQRDQWTWEGTVEVTCNLFSMFAMHNVCQRPRMFWQDRADPTAVAQYFAAGCPITTWHQDATVALTLYAHLIDRFGWEALQTVLLLSDGDGDDSDAPQTVAAKMARWSTLYSQVTGCNLLPFFAAWGWDIDLAADGASVVWDLPAVSCSATGECE